MKRTIAACIGLLVLAGPAAAQSPVAVVEEVQGKVTGAEFMDYVTPKTVIKVPAGGAVTISYMNSCQREKISGLGTVIIGTDESFVQFADVNDRNAAERLTNLKLFVPRERLPPIEDADTFYQADLVGLVAEGPDGAAIGTVSAIHDFGAGDLIEITPNGGGEPMLLPFSEDTVPTVDIAKGRIVVVLPVVGDDQRD